MQNADFSVLNSRSITLKWNDVIKNPLTYGVLGRCVWFQPHSPWHTSLCAWKQKDPKLCMNSLNISNQLPHYSLVPITHSSVGFCGFAMMFAQATFRMPLMKLHFKKCKRYFAIGTVARDDYYLTLVWNAAGSSKSKRKKAHKICLARYISIKYLHVHCTTLFFCSLLVSKNALFYHSVLSWLYEMHRTLAFEIRIAKIGDCICWNTHCVNS